MTETLNFKIEGMTCGGCSGRVKGVLESNSNVESADISHESNAGTVVTNGQITSEELVKIIEQTGFTAAISSSS